MTATDAPKSTAEMMSGIMGNVSNLVRNEVDLARAETAETMDKAMGVLTWIALAAVLAVVGLNVLAASLVSLVVWAGLAPQWATLVVGLGLLLIALIIFFSAKSALHQIGFVPTRTARSVKRDAAVIRDTFHDK